MILKSSENFDVRLLLKKRELMFNVSYMENVLFGKYEPVIWDIETGLKDLYWLSTDFVHGRLYSRSYKYEKGPLKKIILFPELIKRPTSGYYTATFYDSFSSAYPRGNFLELKMVAKFPESQVISMNVLRRSYQKILHIPSASETINSGITPSGSLATNIDINTKYNLNRHFGLKQVVSFTFVYYSLFMSKFFANSFKNYAQTIIVAKRTHKLLKTFANLSLDEDIGYQGRRRFKRRKKTINFIGFSFKLYKSNLKKKFK